MHELRCEMNKKIYCAICTPTVSAVKMSAQHVGSAKYTAATAPASSSSYILSNQYQCPKNANACAKFNTKFIIEIEFLSH
jgi:hypothetical protein